MQHRDSHGDHGSLPCDQGLRVDAGGQPCLWWSQGCTLGCDVCTGVLKSPGRYCNSTLQPTLPKHAWTMNVAGKDSPDPKDKDTYRYFPWRYPGKAPVADPCKKCCPCGSPVNMGRRIVKGARAHYTVATNCHVRPS